MTRETDGVQAEDLLPIVYDRLRGVARRVMAGERSDHTLGATGLVHEAYMRLAGDGGARTWTSEAHLFFAAAEAMRRVLIDHARARNTIKRGGGRVKRLGDVTALAADADPEQILALDEAFSRLEQEDPRAGDVVRLRFYAGLSVEQAARVLGVSERTVAREWAFARARLYDLLTP